MTASEQDDGGIASVCVAGGTCSVGTLRSGATTSAAKHIARGRIWRPNRSKAGPLQVAVDVWTVTGHIDTESTEFSKTCTVAASLPADWRGAKVAGVLAAIDRSCMLLKSWVVVIRTPGDPSNVKSARDKTAEANVWVGEIGIRSKTLSTWAAYHCSVLHEASLLTCETVQVELLDGPRFVLFANDELHVFDAGDHDDLIPLKPPFTRWCGLVGAGGVGGQREWLLCVAQSEGCPRAPAATFLVKVKCEERSAGEAAAARTQVTRVANVEPTASRREKSSDASEQKQSSTIAIGACGRSGQFAAVSIDSGTIVWVNVANRSYMGTSRWPTSMVRPLRLRLFDEPTVAFLTGVDDQGSVATWSLSADPTRSFGGSSRGWQTYVSGGRENTSACIAAVGGPSSLRRAPGAGDVCFVHAAMYDAPEDAETERFVGAPLEGGNSSAPVNQRHRVEERLQRRLEAGLRDLVDGNIILEEKSRLVSHAKRLIGHITCQLPAPLLSCAFLDDLPVLNNPNLRAQLKNDREYAEPALQDRAIHEGVGIVAPQQVARARRATVVKASHFLDPTSAFLVIAVDVSLGETHNSSLPVSNGDAKLALTWLEIQSDSAMNTCWESVGVAPSEGRPRCTLIARTGISEILSARSHGLSNLVAELTAVSGRQQSERLGRFGFSLCVVRALWSGKRRSPPAWCSEAYKAYAMSLELVARGPSAPQLVACAGSRKKRYVPAELNVTVSENSARLQVAALSDNALAGLAADVSQFVSDDVGVIPAPLTNTRVLVMNQALRELSNELFAVRDAGKGRKLDSPSLVRVLQFQLDTDEAFGVMEEMQAGNA